MREVPGVPEARGGSRVTVFVGNGSKTLLELAQRYTEQIGHLFSPSYWRPPRPGVPYVLDNDAFGAWRKGTAWNESAWLAMLDKAARTFAPLWALVPDVVANREATLANWARYRDVVAQRGWPCAFAVQDGMTLRDVPRDADVVFVGGTTEWKWSTVAMWCREFPRVHVGRVRTTKLRLCEWLGAESVDGTGWFRESQDGAPIRFLKAWLAEPFHYRRPPLALDRKRQSA